METYKIYLDETGMADPKTWDKAPFFTICGFVMHQKNRKDFAEDIENLKLRYFGKKAYILRGADIKRDLKRLKRSQQNFSKDLYSILIRYHFFLLYVVVDKEKAFKKSWDSTHIYKRSYRIILSNLTKFLIAKKYKGEVIAEASKPEQDIHIYKALFHLIANGIQRLTILHNEVKQHLTCLSFVTKLNNDPEEQMADLFGECGKLQMLLDNNLLLESDLDPLDKVLMKIFRQRIFKKHANIKQKRKLELYNNINPFKIIP